MWHFSSGDLDGRNLKDPAELSVHSHGELSQLQIFVREVLQNALDNRANGSQVSVNIRLLYLEGEDKTSFLNAMKFDELVPHINVVREEQIAIKGKTSIPDPKDVSSKNYQLKTLLIEDYGTRGLTGPEYEKEKEFFPDVACCFLGLCRNVGDSQKSIDVAGGTHGIGKTVLWKNSRLKTILFYSRMILPYRKQHDNSELWNRFFGQIRLPGHYVGDDAYRGEGYFGKRENKLTWSLYDNAADEYAKKFGLQMRNAASYGTTIIVTDFDDPDIPDDEEDKTDTANRIKEAAERYFWPAIIDNRLQIRIIAGTASETESLFADPQNNSDLLPFIKAYKAATINQQSDDVDLRNCEVEIPKGPENEKMGKAMLMVATRHGEPDKEFAHGAFDNRAALIRGAGMVVGYWPVTRRGIGGQDFHSVVLGGSAYPELISTSEQGRLEKLLAWAEPVTHDNWTPNAEMLRSWYGAKSAVNKIKGQINQAISDATMTKSRPQGKAASLLAKMFPLGTDEAPEPEPRDIHVEVTRPPFRLETDNSEKPQYGFEVKLKIPAKSRFRKDPKPNRWRVTCKYGFYGEGRGRRIIETAKSRFIKHRIDSGPWHDIETDFQVSAMFEEDVRNAETIYELIGITEPLDNSLARLTKHDLEVVIQRGYEEEL